VSDKPGLRLVAIAGSAPGTVRLDGEEVPTITAALGAARSGSIIDIGRGHYGRAAESFPLRVPDEVTLRGPAPPDIPREARKHLPTPAPAALVADGPVLEVLGSDVRIEHLDLRSTRPGTGPAVVIGAGERVIVDSCTVSGTLQVSGARDPEIRWTSLEHGRVVGTEVRGLGIVGGGVTGTHGTGALVEVDRGTDLRIEATALTDGVVGVALTSCRNVLIGGCAVLADDTAIRIEGSRHLAVSGNRLRAPRAVHLSDCTDGEITANGVEWADVAFTLAHCTGIAIGSNHIGDARATLDETPG
jgi:hypothetical protein